MSFCPQGDFCQSAHTTKEILYHPLTFKTTPCQLNHSIGDSLSEPFCPFYHSMLDKREASAFINPVIGAPVP